MTSLQLFLCSLSDALFSYLIFRKTSFAPTSQEHSRGEAARAGGGGNFRKPCAGVKVERSEAA